MSRPITPRVEWLCCCRSIHDHANSHCFMRVMDGSLQEVQYSWPDSSHSGTRPMAELATRDLCTDTVTYINGRQATRSVGVMLDWSLQILWDFTASKTPATLTPQCPCTCTVLPSPPATPLSRGQVGPTLVQSLSTPKQEHCAPTTPPVVAPHHNVQLDPLHVLFCQTLL